MQKMYAVPSLKPEKVSELNTEVAIATPARNNLQVGSIKEPGLVQRLSLPYGKTADETTDDDDYSMTIDLCDASQVKFFNEIEAEVSRQCKATFGDVPIKPIVLDNMVKLKLRKYTDVTTLRNEKLTIADLGAHDKVILIIRVSCLWKSQTMMGASLRVIRVLQLEKGKQDSLPNFILD